MLAATPALRGVLEKIEDRILAYPTAIGKRCVNPPDVWHAKVGEHWVIFWKADVGQRTVEFGAVGHWDTFFANARTKNKVPSLMEDRFG